MKLGIVGLPNVGKSTLFNSLTKAGALAANYPFATIDPNVGIVQVPDERIEKLGELYHTKKVTHAVIEFVDIAGLVKGASKGEGLGNQFLANIREVDAIVHVVRCFEDTNVVHVDGNINPARDIETINFELIFSDIEILDRRIAKIAKQARMDKTLAKELELTEAIKAHLESGKMARTFEVPEDEDAEIWFRSYNLLTAKKTIYAANVAEDDLADDAASNQYVQQVREMAKEELDWNKSTTYTILRRLCERGIFQNENGTVTSLITKDEFFAVQSEQFVDETFDGSLPAFIAAFTQRKKLSKEEIEEIQAMIDAAKEN